jgi:metallo-beta-lactamase class B/metallo-beta-lactamase class B GIM
LSAAIAICPAALGGSADLEITELASGVYLHTSYRNMDGHGPVGSNGLIVLYGNRAVIVDTPWSGEDTEQLLSWINGRGLRVEASISTHSHEDRTAGIEVLNALSVPTFTSTLTNEILIREGRPAATNVIAENEFSLLDGRLEIFYPGAGHTEDNLVAWLPDKGFLFGGCLVRSIDGNSLGFTGDASIESWAGSIRNIKSKYSGIVVVVPGHGSPGNAEILDHTIRLAEMAQGLSAQAAVDASAE